MSRTLTWKIERRGAETHVVMSGDITEAVPLEPLASELASAAASVVTFDLAGIRAVSSIGVRNWLLLLRDLEGQGGALVLERCSVPIVHQLSMVAGFEGKGGTVRSIFAPYYCADCNHAEDRLFPMDAAGMAERVLETGVCPKCGGALEFDDLPEHYIGLARALDQRQGV